VAAHSKSTVSRSDLFSHTTVTNLNPDRLLDTPTRGGGAGGGDSYDSRDITVTTDSAAVNEDNPIIGETMAAVMPMEMQQQ
jgi:hypothetical protein